MHLCGVFPLFLLYQANTPFKKTNPCLLQEYHLSHDSGVLAESDV